MFGLKTFFQSLLGTLAIVLVAMPAVNAVRTISSIKVDFANVGVSQLVDKDHPVLEIEFSNKKPNIIKPFNEPVVSISFDDGWQSQYYNALPALEKFGIDATFYIVTEVIGSPDYMSYRQLKELLKGQHEVGSHTVSHADLVQIEQEKIAYELVNNKNTLEEKLGIKVRSFASPYNSYNQKTLSEIKKYFVSHRTTDVPPLNYKSSFDRYKIKSITILNTTTTKDIKDLLAEAKNTNTWLVLSYHKIDKTQSRFSVTPEVFEQHLNAINESKIKTATISQFIEQVD